MRRPIPAAVSLSLIVLLVACSGGEQTVERQYGDRVATGGVIENIEPLNSADDEFAPMLADDHTLLFTSNRAGRPQAVLVDSQMRYGEVLYLAERENGSWQAARPFFSGNEAGNYQGASAAFGDDVYFSSPYLQPSAGGTDLYVIHKAIGQWSSPEPLVTLSGPWWEAHPAISPDGTQLVFASDRQSGRPGFETAGSFFPDLWISQRGADGVWGVPERLPAPVNTDAAEISPFFGSDGALYFASDRNPGQGFDIMRTRFGAGGWEEPEVLPAPVNSAADDVFPWITPDRTRIFLASDRPGGKGGLDLYTGPYPHVIRLEGTVAMEGRGSAGDISLLLEDLDSGTRSTIVTDASGLYRAQLQAGRRYRLKVANMDCYSAEAADIAPGVPYAIDTVIVRDFTLHGEVMPAFQLGRYNIPFFVTGYYHPNTTLNYIELQERIRYGELDLSEGGSTPYIDMNDEDYESYVPRIDAIFDSVYTTIINQYLPLFNKCALSDERLQIEVRGYVDPRGLRPGRYVDESVETATMSIEKGATMQGQEGNRKLANLRAWHTMQIIDEELAKRSPRYRELKAAGRIVLRAVGVGIDTESGGERQQDPAKRRIDVRLSIVQ
ncbi:MAG: PD40 domain-containing protein [Bacteroidetes bacterium]|nr:PD40 domain-containing protein [Bacteroidota bacterium]